MAETPPLNILGVRVSGDLAGATIYTDRYGKKIWFDKAPPEKPPSLLQRRVRLRFARAVHCWTRLSLHERARWEDASLRLSLPMTGHNTFVSIHLRCDPLAWRTLSRQYGKTLPWPCYHVPGLTPHRIILPRG